VLGALSETEGIGAVGGHDPDVVVAPQRLMKAIFLPSGDQAGWMSSASLAVSCAKVSPVSFVA
jgi:hypothetical protein